MSTAEMKTEIYTQAIRPGVTVSTFQPTSKHPDPFESDLRYVIGKTEGKFRCEICKCGSGDHLQMPIIVDNLGVRTAILCRDCLDRIIELVQAAQAEVDEAVPVNAEV